MPGGLDLGEVGVTVKHLAAHLHPVIKKDGLHLSHHRTFRPIVNVAPVLGVLSVAGPLVGDAYAAGEADAPVYYQELSVRAVVDAREVIPAQGVVSLDLNSSLLHAVEQRLLHFKAAYPVEQHMHPHSSARAF